MSLFPLKPSSAYVKIYYAALGRFQQHGHTTEGNTRSAFADLLKRAAAPYGWHLVEEYQFKGTGKQSLRADGALVDALTLVHGLWEAKDTADDLEREIKTKVAKGYPLSNILFQSPNRAVLYQDNRIALDCDLTKPANLVEVLELFFEHRQPHEVDWEEAVVNFAEEIPDLAEGVTVILEGEHKKNGKFRARFADFAELCRQSINPELTDEAIRKMLVQHLLTERIFRKVFNNQEFLSRNVIAAEIEKVIRSITARHFSRDEFLKPLDRFYTAIEHAAETQEGYTEKQHFLNAVYEKFFQSFDKKQADTHGIVYTPQPIVDFMVRSVEEVLRAEFGKSLSDEGVHILDPFTGTGNFITRIMQEIKRSRLQQKYAEELHCNEVMLLPYYIASMNIEHAYMERMGEYRPFDGICLVDTFEVAAQASLFTAENTARIKRQNAARITLVLGNPPYNAGQEDESDDNQNRKYPDLDGRIKSTYKKSSQATLKNSLTDPYVRAFRWASDRIDKQGIVCFVSNNGFLDGIAFDGMRKHLEDEFSLVLHLNLKGDARTSGERRKREAGNVFNNQIRVGVGITLLVKNASPTRRGLHILSVEDYLKAPAKVALLEEWGSFGLTPLAEVEPSSDHVWLTGGLQRDYHDRMMLGAKSVPDRGCAIFASYSNAPKSNNDAYVFSYDREVLKLRAENMMRLFSEEHARWRRHGRPKDLGKFLGKRVREVKWIRRAKLAVKQEQVEVFSDAQMRFALYRPFNQRSYFFSKTFNEDRYSLARYVPLQVIGGKNVMICVSGKGSKQPFAAHVVSRLLSHDYLEKTQCFPFYTYNEDGTNRQENITDWALDQYRTHYADPSLTKWDIFHSTYALLHHPEYRTRYAANLKRELPRIPFPPDLHAFAKAGKRLMELHIDYEQQPEYPLREIENPKVPFTLRVERMAFSKDKQELRYNEALTLSGIPPEAFDYRLGNRSAIEWVVDQYRVSTDARSGIVNDPNRADDERYILRLIGQVITVSLETQEIVRGLPTLGLGEVEDPAAEAGDPAVTGERAAAEPE